MPLQPSHVARSPLANADDDAKQREQAARILEEEPIDLETLSV